MNKAAINRLARAAEESRADVEKRLAKTIQENDPTLSWGEALRRAVDSLPPLGVVRAAGMKDGAA